MIRSLYEQVGETVTEPPNARSSSGGPFDSSWLEPLGRYLSLTDKPLEAQMLGPSILRDVHFHLLISPIAGMLRNLLSVESHVSPRRQSNLEDQSRLSRTAGRCELGQDSWDELGILLRAFQIGDGNHSAAISKNLRMISARNLLQSGQSAVSAAGFEVGCESPTHFSQGYTRKFGVAPTKDVMR